MTYKKLLELFDAFRKGMGEYYVLPRDLQLDLEEIRNWIERNKKNA